MLNKIFGPSLYLLVLDKFLEHPDSLMNLRKVAHEVGKNPGSVIRIMPLLVSKGFLKQNRVGKKMLVYQINKESELINLIQEFFLKVKNLIYI